MYKQYSKVLFIILTSFVCVFLSACDSSATSANVNNIPGEPIVLTEEQEKRVEYLIVALSFGGIRYNFDSIKDIAPENLCAYLSKSGDDFTEDDVRIGYDPNHPLKGWMDEEQVLEVLKEDFVGVNEMPFKLTAGLHKAPQPTNNLAVSVQWGVLNRESNITSITVDKNLLYAVVDYEYLTDYRSTEEYSDVPNTYMLQKVLYTFETQSDGNIKIKSGKVLHD